jgi:hypothetical protein
MVDSFLYRKIKKPRRDCSQTGLSRDPLCLVSGWAGSVPDSGFLLGCNHSASDMGMLAPAGCVFMGVAGYQPIKFRDSIVSERWSFPRIGVFPPEQREPLPQLRQGIHIESIESRNHSIDSLIETPFDDKPRRGSIWRTAIYQDSFIPIRDELPVLEYPGVIDTRIHETGMNPSAGRSNYHSL